MDYQKLDTALFLRISSALAARLKAAAKKDRRKLATFIRLHLETSFPEK